MDLQYENPERENALIDLYKLNYFKDWCYIAPEVRYNLWNILYDNLGQPCENWNVEICNMLIIYNAEWSKKIPKGGDLQIIGISINK